MDFSGPTTEAGGPGPGPAVPHGLQRGRRGGRGVPPVHRGLSARRQGPGGVHDHRRPRGGRLPAPARGGRADDRRRARPADAQSWLRSFTDVRLALATRLGVEEDDEDYWLELPDDDPRSQAHDIYHWVGYLQETLVEALTR